MAKNLSDNGFQFKENADILGNMIDTALIRSSKLNDFTPGSISRTLFESESLELETLYYLTLENLNHAIDESVLQAFGFETQQSTYAYGNLEINFSGALPSDLYIPAGTQFRSSNSAYNQRYITLEDYRVPRGNGSAVIVVYCTETGALGNVPANTIDVCSDMSSIATLRNPEDFLTGADEEPLESTKKRFRAMIQALARGTRQSLEQAALQVPGVTGASVYESTYGTVIVYAHDANGNLNDLMQEQVAEAVAQYKPAGIQVLVRPIHKTMVNLNIGVNVKFSEYEDSKYLELIRQAVVDYLNSYSVGETLYLNDVVQQVMDANNVIIRDTNIEYEVIPDISLRDDAYMADDTVANVDGMLVTQEYLKDPDIITNDTYGFPSPHNPLKDKGQTWKDTQEEYDTDDDGNQTNPSLAPISLYSNYHTAENELLRAGTVQMTIIEDDDIIPVTHISLKPDSADMKTGDTMQFRAVLFPQNATNKKIKWISSNETVAMVDDEGSVYALSEGATNILAMSSDDTQITATARVNVTGETVAPPDENEGAQIARVGSARVGEARVGDD